MEIWLKQNRNLKRACISVLFTVERQLKFFRKKFQLSFTKRVSLFCASASFRVGKFQTYFPLLPASCTPNT